MASGITLCRATHFRAAHGISATQTDTSVVRAALAPASAGRQPVASINQHATESPRYYSNASSERAKAGKRALRASERGGIFLTHPDGRGRLMLITATAMSKSRSYY